MASIAVVGGGGARSTGPQLIIEVDRSGTTILVASGRHPAVCRRLGVGGEAMDGVVAARLGIDLDAAGELRRGRMDADRDDLPPAVERAAREAIRPLLRDLATAVRMTVRNFGATFRGPTPGREIYHFVRNLHAMSQVRDPRNDPDLIGVSQGVDVAAAAIDDHKAILRSDDITRVEIAATQ